MSDKLRFVPVKGIEADILATPYTEGKLYFAIDTKKIYLDANGKNKVPMGGAGNSGIYYGRKEFSEAEDQTNVVFNLLLDIEGTELPQVDDLILNSSNGSFYRVIAVNSSTSEVTGIQLTVAGSGGGGYIDPSSNVNLTLDVVSGIKTGQTYVHGQSSNIVFKGNIDNGDTTMIYQIEVVNTYAGTETSKTYGPFSADVNTEYTFDLGKVLKLGTNTVEIVVSSDNANKNVSRRFTLLKCVEMYLKEEIEDFNPLKYFKGNFNFYCTPMGADLTKKIEIYIDDNLLSSLTKTNIVLSGEEQQFIIPAQSHGMHTLKAVLTCEESDAVSFIEYNICCIEDGNDAPVIWYNTTVPNEIVNHDPLTIEYMVYNPVSSVNIVTHYYLNGVQLPTSPQEVNYSPTAWLKWRVLNYVVGDNMITLSTGTTTVSIPIEVKPDTKRNLDLVTAGLHVNLSAAGRSNNENAQSRSTWTCTSTYDGTTKTSVKFNDFNWYNNGWITDDDGETCLRISNGASIEIPLSVMNTKALTDSLGFELVFKVRNVRNYSTLINTIVEDPESENPKITKVVSSTDGVWGSYYNNSIGFCMGTQEAFFKSKNALVSGRYKEDELVHVTFVVEAASANSNANKLIYIYINGINSGITKYNIATDTLASQCRTLKINSDYCDIDLYNLRVYKTNLTAQYVVQNYLADYNDAGLYDMNVDIVDYRNGIPSINYVKMLEYNDTHPDALLMPYMVVETTDVNDTLPYRKNNGDGWLVNIEFVNPTLDYEYENDLWTQKDLTDRGFSSKEEMYLHSCPSYKATGVDLNVQGTSSQGYPIRNYKAKFKSASSWIYTNGPLKNISVLKGGTTASGMKVPKKWFMDSWVGENKTTLKADYMDSSSVHNTGFASFVRTLYSKHPLDDYSDSLPEGVDSSKLRTSVYGFPIMMFHKTHDGQYKFLGRYNYNLDKGCDDSFGFCDWGDDSYIDVTSLVNAENFNAKKLYVPGAEAGTYEALDADAEYDSNATYYRLDEGADSNAPNPNYDATNPYSRRYLPWSEAAECWEFSNNQGGRCSLKKADFSETDEQGHLTVVDDFEYRYHVDADSFDNAYAGVGEAKKPKGKVFATQEELNNFVLSKMARYERLVSWIASTDTTAATNEPLETSVTYNGVTYDTDSTAYRLAKFSNEFNQYLDKEYCLIYYIMTELLICYDSRGKNLMMATWGPKVRGGGDIWYPIFYDIDTQLGVNNSGVPYWDYYEEVSKNGTFSTPDSVLWVNLWNCFESEIKNKYDELTGNKLTIANLDGYYRFDPEVSKSKAMAGYRPIIIHNVDEYQKYIAPSISGYVDTQGTSGVITDTFYYCLQGSRELQRALFLRNRFNYLGSQWQAGPYSMAAAKQGIQTRFDANDYPNTSDKFLGRTPTPEEAAAGYVYAEPETEPLDFTCDYQITPYLKQYISYWYDDTKSSTTYAGDGETVTVPMLSNKIEELQNNPHKTQQLVYWGGPEYISSLGDLSKKYLDMFFIQSAKRLKDLLIGSDVDGYTNKMITDQSFKPDDSATVVVDGAVKSNPNAKTLLEKVVLTNLSSLSGTLDFSGSEKLKELRALNTNVSSFILADGVQIAKLHLPETVTNLILKEPTSLTGILSSSAPSTVISDEYYPISLDAEEYDASLYYINTLDGYERCDDDEYFMSIEHSGDYPDYVEGEGLPFNETRSYYRKETVTESVYPNGLYIEGLTNVSIIDNDSAIHLGTIDIVGGNMGYDSYTLLNRAVQIKERMIAKTNLNPIYDKHLAVNLENVHWTPYRLVEVGETPEEEAVYYKLNDHNTFDLYQKISNEYPNWELNVANGSIYEYQATTFTGHQNDIVNLDMFDTFINDYSTAKEVYDSLVSKDNFDADNYNFYQSTDSYAQGPTLANITGIIYINNDANNPIDEAELKNYYHDRYYSKLTMHVANIIKANVAKFVEVVNEETGQEYVWDVLKYSAVGANARTYPEITPIQGSKLNYDFRGWSTSFHTQDELNSMSEEQIEALLVTDESVQNLLFANAEDQVIKFYAVYTIHSYEITFKNTDANQTVLATMVVPYGEYLQEPIFIPTLNESGLDLTSCYSFKGYARSATATDTVNISRIKSVENMTFYAIYEEASVYDNVNEDYFEFVPYNYSESELLAFGGDVSYNLEGYAVLIKRELSGKVTIPATHENTPVIAILKNSEISYGNITHVFIGRDSSNKTYLRQVGVDAFRSCSNLVYFEMTDSIRMISNNAFRACSLDVNTLDLDRNIFYLGSYAFSTGIKGTMSGTFYIGSSITAVDHNALTNLQISVSSGVQWGNAEHFAGFTPSTYLQGNGYTKGRILSQNAQQYAFTLVMYTDCSLETLTVKQQGEREPFIDPTFINVEPLNS